MTAFPAAGAYTENGITQGTKRQRMDDQLEATLQLVGAGAVQSLTIASGSITPAAGASGSIKVDTEGAAATDTLSNISTANLPDGSHIILRIADNGRVVTIGHNDGGAGQIATVDSLDHEMNRVGQWIELRREGSDWTEVRRGGREKEHAIGDAGEPAYQNSWANGTGGGVVFWKDSEGSVHLYGRCEHAATTTLASIMFTLPARYRPTRQLFIPVVYEWNGAPYGGAIVIETDGDVYMYDLETAYPQGTLASTATTIHIGAVSFRAAA